MGFGKGLCVNLRLFSYVLCKLFKKIKIGLRGLKTHSVYPIAISNLSITIGLKLVGLSMYDNYHHCPNVGRLLPDGGG